MRSRVTVIFVVASLAGLALAAPLSAAPRVAVEVSQPLPPTDPPDGYCNVPVTATWKPIAGQALVQLHAHDLFTDVGDDFPHDSSMGASVTSTQGSWSITASNVLLLGPFEGRHRFPFTVSVKDSSGAVLKSGTDRVWLPCYDI